MEWETLLGDLERVLTDLESAGMRHLSIAPDAGLAARLEQAVPRASPAETAPQRGAPPRGGRIVRNPFAQARPAPAPEPAPPAPQPVQPPAGAPPGEGKGQAGTLESLYFQYRDCQACKLGATRNRLVFGTGHARPRLMFIGEGPGAEEDVQGLPFVGRAGGLLTGLIAALGLTREDVYITNVVKCRPPANRNPEPDEVAACQPILLRQIELLNPLLIVSLGNVPLKVLNPAAGGITRERGRVFTYGRWAVLPTFHPSFLLRSPSSIADCWVDFKSAFARVYPDA